jgi:hypothetical protein
VAWTDINNRIFGVRWDAGSHTWGTQQQITTSGTHGSAAVALNATSDGVVLSADFDSQHDVRGYLAAGP